MALVVAVLVPALLGAAWVIREAYHNERELLHTKLRDTTRALSLVVDRDLARRADMARVLADAQMLDAGVDITEENKALFMLQARRALAPMAGWAELTGPNGLLITTQAQPTGTESAQIALPLVDQPVVLPLQDPGDGGGMRAAVVQPVRRDGRTLLNLTLTILPQELQALIDHQILPTEAVATILDPRGLVVARHPGGAQYVGRVASPDMLARFRAHDESIFQSISAMPLGASSPT